ncbi:uncharacterized protein TRUGW13939_04305 [Talaromyces rugulosus]|uniref:Uncharacterized protein n=1 Tax=Talaromyces rugulosus TaxID=121627 RepID=A0A7H8QTA5_TALRU|nr:uncharacterized protein TRUGW13939_04305 [Talaromyces rugulosus]QKX57197.1 hypothetical protein TRUGW13939_04305 [Talaromyces rugulosus]
MARLSWIFVLAVLPTLQLQTAFGETISHHPITRQDNSGDIPKVPLRILPLGASITWGYLSSTGNGYRKPLRDKLRYQGWQVDMVGSKTNGDMKDNGVEAHSGDVISQVQTAVGNSLKYKPNIVLVNAGTNDCEQNLNIPYAGDRMRSLIESLVTAPDMANTAVILSTLIPSGQENIEATRQSVNTEFRTLVETMRADNVSIILADMDPLAPSPDHNWLSYPDDYADPKHPNDIGYSKMASVWYEAIMKAAIQGIIPEPAPVSISPTGTCDKSYGDGIYAGGHTQKGSGEDDGIYYHDSQFMGIYFSVRSGKGAAEEYKDDDELNFFFARLYTQKKDDLLIYQKSSSGFVTFNTYRNTGENEQMFPLGGSFSIHGNCNPGGVHFIDINADGLDDYVCIALDGTAYASVNNGDGDPGSNTPPTFSDIGKWKDAEGYDQAHVRLGDVDGDGRADYCVIADNGDITCWRNGWIENVPAYWQPLGKRFAGKGIGDLRGVRFEDINGDGRDDWLWVGDDGATTTYTNSRSCTKGHDGSGLDIVWRQGFHRGVSSGPTHPGMGEFGSTGLRDNVYFARIHGEPAAFGLLGLQDYVFIQKDTSDKDLGPMYFMHVWKNTGGGGGGGGGEIKADGDRYCNMMGHENGMADYVWIHSTGHMRLYPNKGPTMAPANGESYWGPNKIIFDPTQLEIASDIDRRDLHLVDWDGDGACDIVWTRSDDQNKVVLWRNRIRETGDFNWEYNLNAAPDLYCPEKRGLGFFDRPVHFADVSGNGKGDYLCVEKDGRTWGFIHNNDDGWDYVDQFKYSEQKDRANLHWADVNGDGRADMIHTDKFTGDGTVWYNLGRRDIKGSRYEWAPMGAKYRGAVAGSCTYFPDLDGDGRADMHSILNSIENTADSWPKRWKRVRRDDVMSALYRNSGPPALSGGRNTRPKPINFHFIACSGSTINDIYEDDGTHSSSSGSGGGGGKSDLSQANQLKDLHPDMVTLTTGGNDVNFADVLDRCVYRFYDLKGCGGCTPSATFNDCSDDCDKAMVALEHRMKGQDFIPSFGRAINAIFQSAPTTHLFVTGYPAFWNAETDACDKVSFKFGCINNPVLPLIKRRRKRMNDLTCKLNGIIERVVKATSPPAGGSIHYVDVDPYFEGHRFCEEGVSEPSYRNSDIWFYPFEYSTGNTFTLSADSQIASVGDDCSAIWEDNGDAGDYFSCALNNATASGDSIDLSKLPNNVPGDGDVDLSSSSGSKLPTFLARIFHPTINGFTAYKRAVIDVYLAAA